MALIVDHPDVPHVCCYPCKVRVLDDGSTAVDGGPDLKSSQEYPLLFGVALARLFTQHRLDVIQMIAASRASLVGTEISLCEFMNADDDWADANLDPVFDVLMNVL